MNILFFIINMPIYTYKYNDRETKCWYKNNKYHRNCDLPVVEWISGNKFWYKNGKWHRDDDLPAIEWADGSKNWYKNNLYHRDNNLPAIEYSNSTKFWYKNGIRYYPIEQLIIIDTMMIIKVKIVKMGNKWWYTFHN